MKTAREVLDQARTDVATLGPNVAYTKLCAVTIDDPKGLVALECARLALSLKHPARALEHLDVALRQDPQSAEVPFEQGRAFNNLRRFGDAAVAFDRALRLEPDWLVAHLHLAHVLRADGQFAQALQRYEKALKIEPESAPAHTGAATMCQELGAMSRAEHHFAKACSLEPGSPGLWWQWGHALQSAGRPEAAVSVLLEAVRLAPQVAQWHSALGSAHQSCGDLESARACFEKAVALEPDHAAANAALAGILDLQGHAERARAQLGSLLDTATPDPVVLVAYANLKSNRQLDDMLVVQLGEMAARRDVPPALRSLVEFRLGDGFNQRADYGTAFRHYRAGNALRETRFDQAALEHYSATLIERIASAGAGVAYGGVRPIFIVGLPRSGTSLLEQILAQHPDIGAAGEQRALAVAAHQGLGESLQRSPSEPLDPLALRDVAQRYRAALEQHAEGKALCTDKMWQNFEWLWLVRQALPRAAILHCTRHPLGVGLSCYMQSFGAAPPPFSTRLDDIAAYIGHHHAVMSAWEAAGSPQTLNVPYESVVSDLEGQVRRILAFLELPFEPACLQFHAGSRAVTTASFAQVEQPLYTGARERWRHYLEDLGPLITGLQRRGVPVESGPAGTGVRKAGHKGSQRADATHVQLW
ncbi:MAG: sulfotransferase [Gammaproteobacteria bacterium]